MGEFERLGGRERVSGDDPDTLVTVPCVVIDDDQADIAPVRTAPPKLGHAESLVSVGARLPAEPGGHRMPLAVCFPRSKAVSSQIKQDDPDAGANSVVPVGARTSPASSSRSACLPGRSQIGGEPVFGPHVDGDVLAEVRAFVLQVFGDLVRRYVPLRHLPRTLGVTRGGPGHRPVH